MRPRARPQAVIDKLSAEILRILAMPDIKERFAAGGVDTIPGGPADLAARIKREADHFKVIIQKADIRPD